MVEEAVAGSLRLTYADLAQDIEHGRLEVTRLGAEYFATKSELHRWQLDWLRANLRERYTRTRPGREAS